MSDLKTHESDHRQVEAPEALDRDRLRELPGATVPSHGWPADDTSGPPFPFELLPAGEAFGVCDLDGVCS